MVSVKEVLRPYLETDSLNRWLQVWGFIGSDVFLTKAGEVGLCYRIKGIDYEGADHEQRQDVAHRFESALRLLNVGYRVYQYLLKRRVDPFPHVMCANPIAAKAIQQHHDHLNQRLADLYRIDHYLVLMSEGANPADRTTKLTRFFRTLRTDPRRAVREWLSAEAVTTLLQAELDEVVTKLRHKASAFEGQFGDIGPTRLEKAETFQFLQQLLNPAPHKLASLKYDTHVDYFAVHSAIVCEDNHLVLDGRIVRVLTMREPPAKGPENRKGTYAHMLEQLNAIPAEFNACLEWRRRSDMDVQTQIKRRRRWNFNQRTSVLSNLGKTNPQPHETLTNTSAIANVDQLGEALKQLETEGVIFGDVTLTLAIYDQDPAVVAQATAEAIKVMATKDGEFHEETYNAWNAWLAIHPGNHAYNLRALTLSVTNLADLSFLFTLHRGAPTSAHLRQDALAVLETHTCSPYWWNLHVEDVGHTAIFGNTGSGKSFFLNFLLTMAQRYDPQTFVIDIGHSYRPLTRLLGGSYLELGDPASPTTLNPFACAPTEANLNFLHTFVRMLLEGRDGNKLSQRDDRDLYRGIVTLMTALDPDQQRLNSLIHLVPRGLKARLDRWREGGQYGWLFDHEVDTLSISTFQAFDFSAQARFPDLIDPLLFYILQRMNTYMTTHPGFKLVAIDEVAGFLQHPKLLQFLVQFLKTARKANGSLVLATQAIEDFNVAGASGDLIRTVVQSCPTKVFLASRAVDRERHADLFQLNAMELDLLARIASKREALIKTPDITRRVHINVDPKSYWIYTNTPVDNARRDAAIAKFGFDEALNQLSREPRELAHV